jgi:amino acid transporter
MIGLVPLPLAVEATLHAKKFHSNPIELVPTNALTIVCHLFTSLLLSLSYLLYGIKTMNAGFMIVLTIIGLCVSATAYLFYKIERKKPPLPSKQH